VECFLESLVSPFPCSPLFFFFFVFFGALFQPFFFSKARNNLLGSGEVSRKAKKDRAKKRELTRNGGSKKELICTGELLDLVLNGGLEQALQSLTLPQIKEAFCIPNKIPRSGAKYEVIQNVRSHLEGFRRQQDSQNKASLAAGGDLVAEFELKVKQEVKFNAGVQLAEKLVAKQVPKQSTYQKRFDAMYGVTKGMDGIIYAVVSGPNASKYNGKYGEGAVDANDWIADSWIDFFTDNKADLTAENLSQSIETLSGDWRSDAYGFSPVLSRISRRLPQIFEEGEDLQEAMYAALENIGIEVRTAPKKLKASPVVVEKVKEEKPLLEMWANMAAAETGAPKLAVPESPQMEDLF
jgi:hypothetical protein